MSILNLDKLAPHYAYTQRLPNTVGQLRSAVMPQMELIDFYMFMPLDEIDNDTAWTTEQQCLFPRIG